MTGSSGGALLFVIIGVLWVAFRLSGNDLFEWTKEHDNLAATIGLTVMVILGVSIPIIGELLR